MVLFYVIVPPSNQLTQLLLDLMNWRRRRHGCPRTLSVAFLFIGIFNSFIISLKGLYLLFPAKPG